MGKSETETHTAEEVKAAIGKISGNYPAAEEKTFKTIFQAICETYDLENPVDQMIANRATSQLMTLQYCQKMLKTYGLFTEHIDKAGQIELKMNPLAYFIKQVESEFRANIRMLRGYGRKDDVKPESFLQFLEQHDEKEKNKCSKDKD